MAVYRSVRRQICAALAVAAIFALVSACAQSGIYPTVLDDPTEPSDPTLTPAQVKLATDNLLTDRDHLHSCAQQIASAPPNAAPPQCASTIVTGSTPAAGAAAKP
jgi:hypothetical protein